MSAFVSILKCCINGASTGTASSSHISEVAGIRCVCREVPLYNITWLARDYIQKQQLWHNTCNSEGGKVSSTGLQRQPFKMHTLLCKKYPPTGVGKSRSEWKCVSTMPGNVTLEMQAGFLLDGWFWGLLQHCCDVVNLSKSTIWRSLPESLSQQLLTLASHLTFQ